MPAEQTPAPLAGPLVIDASAVIEYLVALTHTAPATRLFHQTADGRVELWAPDLLYPECASALRKLVHLGALAASAAENVVEHLTLLPITTAGTAPLIPAVWKLREYLTPYDACYVALADTLGTEFVTAEQKLVEELRKRGKRARFLGDL